MEVVRTPGSLTGQQVDDDYYTMAPLAREAEAVDAVDG